jgi:hypothetical protein
VAVFLRLASASGGRLHAAGSSWLLAGLVTLGVVLAAVAVAFGMGNRPGVAPSKRAAILGSATGIAWGFVATGPWDLAGEALALALVAAGAATLSRSCFIRGELGDPSCLPASIQAQAVSR